MPDLVEDLCVERVGCVVELAIIDREAIAPEVENAVDMCWLFLTSGGGWVGINDAAWSVIAAESAC